MVSASFNRHYLATERALTGKLPPHTEVTARFIRTNTPIGAACGGTEQQQELPSQSTHGTTTFAWWCTFSFQLVGWLCTLARPTPPGCSKHPLQPRKREDSPPFRRANARFLSLKNLSNVGRGGAESPRALRIPAAQKKVFFLFSK